MNSNKVVRAELDQLLREGLLDGATYRRLAELYPLSAWDWRSLARWLLIFGAISAAAGAVILLRDVFVFTLQHVALLLALATGSLLIVGWRLRQRSWPWSGRSAELMAGFALIGLTFVIGMIYSTGSHNWSAPLLIDLVLLLILSYVLKNVLLCVLCAVVFFSWFGGATGYDSGWGMYWLGMNYPLRFLGASVVIVLIGLMHLNAERGPLAAYRGFCKVWISFGLLVGELALWMLSIFGVAGDVSDFLSDAAAGWVGLFILAWTALNIGLIYAGIRYSFRLLKAYGATFLVIDMYTLFFTQVAVHIGLLASLVVVGGSAMRLAYWLETVRRGPRAHG